MHKVFYQDKLVRIETPTSEDPSIAKIKLFGISGVMAVDSLIKLSRNDLETTNTDAYDFAGHHGGMPRNEVWAIGRFDKEGSQIKIEPFIDEIASRAGEAMLKVIQLSKQA